MGLVWTVNLNRLPGELHVLMIGIKALRSLTFPLLLDFGEQEFHHAFRNATPSSYSPKPTGLGPYADRALILIFRMSPQVGALDKLAKL